MHINKVHGTRAAAGVGAVLAVAMGLCAPAGGEPVTHQYRATPGLAAVQAPDLQASGPGSSSSTHQGLSALPAYSPIGKQAHSHPEISLFTERGQPVRTPVRMGGPSMAPSGLSGVAKGVSEDALWRRELADTVLEFIVPAYEGLTATGILQAVRSLETELGLNQGHSFDAPGVHAPHAGARARPESVGWSVPGTGTQASRYSRSDAQIAEYQRLAAIKIKELIDDATLWALALVGLYGLGFLVRLALHYRRIKTRGRRSSSSMVPRRRRHRQHRRRPAV